MMPEQVKRPNPWMMMMMMMMHRQIRCKVIHTINVYLFFILCIALHVARKQNNFFPHPDLPAPLKGLSRSSLKG